MNPQWNTPPDGDFASYVERLTAQAALPRSENQNGEHGLDVGMTPSSEPHNAIADAASAARRSAQSNGEVRPAAGSGDVVRKMIKVLGIVWVLILLVLLSLDVPLGVVAVVFAIGLWLAHKLRRLALPPGMENWKQWVEAAARKQQEHQQQKRRGK
ncbi:hypothetical protein LJR290_002064 [Variovorax sp. LjRoot290]|uniref:hypothetical protein n=1 Tax=unclassified Variovorax TaxID=663243 RepID=UPI000883256A|nr:hypothetical protein [Variovorax sp. CF079]SDC14025.1 hypothetical protein SAMN05444679_101428 [Variovorax sp. CF079]